MKKKRNGLIELLRFIGCLSIALFHYEWIYVGKAVHLSHFYIFVELFFIVSGFFLALEATKANKSKYSDNALKYVFKQFMRLYPLYLIAFFIIFFFVNKNTIGVSNWLINFWSAKWELLLLNTFNFGNRVVYNQGGAPYFISSLLVASGILFYIINKNTNLFKNILGPLIICGGLSYLINTYGNLSQWHTYNLFISSGLIRALADMSVGAWFYIVVLPHVLKAKKYILYLLCILQVLAYVFLILLSKYISYSDLIIYVFIFGLTTCVCYCININSKANDFLCFLGKLSYPIFLFHYVILLLMKTYIPNCSYSLGIILYIVVLLIVISLIVVVKDVVKIKIIKKQV